MKIFILLYILISIIYIINFENTATSIYHQMKINNDKFLQYKNSNNEKLDNLYQKFYEIENRQRQLETKIK